MDRDEWGANTDNIVVVEADRQRLLWVPRDLWCPSLGIRVNKAYARGGHTGLLAALAEQGVTAQHSLCLRRAAAERALAGIEVAVPVDERLDLVYPLAPTTRIQDGRKVVTFRPPVERLSGERVHQWIGARRSLSGAGGDLARIRRQQVLVRRVLEEGCDLSPAFADPDLVRASGPAALAEVAAVRADWRFEAIDDVAPRTIAGCEVLVRRRRSRLLAAAGASPAARLAKGTLRRLLFGALVLPTWGPGRPPRRSRLLALLAVRNDAPYLPGYLRNVGPQVDGIVAYDDGSTDGGAELLARSPEVLEVIRGAPDRAAWDEVGNYRLVHAAALRHGAQWMLSLDADERVERGFRERAERAIRRGARLGLSAFAVRLRELWGSPDRYRCDGVWGRKRPARLFRALPDHQFDYRPLHGIKAPLQARVRGGFVCADLIVYHLRSLRPEDRVARRDRYRALDPEAQWQPGLGYDYLADERGLRLARVGRRRGFDA
jgi:hypothetical protein